MVNLAKRMRNLHAKLIRVRNDQGAAVLPPPPAPQVTELYLAHDKPKLNHQPGSRTENDPSPENFGARGFWRTHLPRLKFHNPDLPIIVDKTASKSFLRLTFESNDENTLRAIRHPKKHAPVTQDRSSLGDSPSPIRRTQEEEASPNDPEEDSDAVVVLKPQPPADPSTPSSTRPPETVYTRTMTMSNLQTRNPNEIWQWFERVTGAKPVPWTRADQVQNIELDKFKKKARADRRRVLAGMEALRKQREDLRRAKEAAERLSQE